MKISTTKEKTFLFNGNCKDNRIVEASDIIDEKRLAERIFKTMIPEDRHSIRYLKAMKRTDAKVKVTITPSL